MDVFELLLNRSSQPRLVAPAPSEDDLQLFIQAAGRVPDHAQLKPWRFIAVQDTGLDRLGELFKAALKSDQPLVDSDALEKAVRKPHRAPLILVVVATLQQHPKVPKVEQRITAGCAAHAVLYAAQAKGYGAMWRTGSMAYHEHVKTGLGLQANEEIVGFLYLGTAASGGKRIAELDPAEVLSFL